MAENLNCPDKGWRNLYGRELARPLCLQSPRVGELLVVEVVVEIRPISIPTNGGTIFCQYRLVGRVRFSIPTCGGTTAEMTLFSAMSIF